MARLTEHEMSFFRALSDEGPFSKEAVELDPDVEDALGIPGVSPRDLEDAEAKAKSQTELGGIPKREKPQPEPPQELPPEEPPPEEPYADEVAAEDELASTHPPEELEEPEPDPVLEQFPHEEEPVDDMAEGDVPPDEVIGEISDEPSPADVPPELLTASFIRPEKGVPDRSSHGKLFSHRQAHPLTLFGVLDARYQGEWSDWEPETLWHAVRRDFGPVGELAREKILAARVAATTDIPWEDWDVFENCALAWNDIIPIFGAMQPLAPTQAAFGVHVLRGIRDEIEGEQEFSNEVSAYIAAVLDEHGWVYAPTEYFPEQVQRLLDRKDWLLEFKGEVSSAWDQVRDRDPREIIWRDDNPLDMHLLKLFVIQEYLRDREKVFSAFPIQQGEATTAA